MADFIGRRALRQSAGGMALVACLYLSAAAAPAQDDILVLGGGSARCGG